MKSNQELAKGTEKTGNKKFSLSKPKEVVAINSGERVSNDTEPIIETASQMNKFKINKLGCELMGLLPGMRVKIITSAEDTIDGKYLICVAPDTDSKAAKVLSPTGAKGMGAVLFNYAGVYSKIAQADVTAQEKGGAAFVEDGMAIDRDGTYYLNRKVAYTLVEVDNYTEDEPLVDPISGNSYSKVFALVEPKIESVDLSKETKPRTKKDVTNSDEKSENTKESLDSSSNESDLEA